ncbi:MAG: YbaB/EbfC family nucleoid-associated protein [Elusimicrobiales bacterium]
MFDKIRELYELKNKAEEIKKELDSIKFTSEDDISSVTVRGTMEVDSIVIKCELTQSNKSKIENSIKENINRATRNAQIESARKMLSKG